MTIRTEPPGSVEDDVVAPRLTWRQVRGLAIALAAVAVGARAWVALQGYFFVDDYIFVVQASTHSLWSPDFLFRPHFGHLMPGGHALTWLLTRAAPFSMPAFVAASTAMQAVAAVLVWRLLRQLFGRTPWVLVPFTVAVLSPLTLPASMWWAAAVNALPLQIAMTLAASAFVAHHRQGRTRDLVATVGWTLVGLAFFEKAVLIPLVLLALGFVLADERNPLRAVSEVLRRSPRLWVALGITVGGYLAAYRATIELSARGTPGPGYVRSVLHGGVVETFLPALAGGPWRWVPFDTPAAAPPTALRWLALAAVAAVVTVSSVRRRAARRAWLALAAYVVVELVLLLLGRSLFPSVISQQYRYYADAALLVSVAVGASVMAPAGTARGDDGAHRPGRLATAVVVAVGVNAYVISSMVSYASFAGMWRDNPTRPFVTNAIASLQAHPGLTVLDQPAPGTVVFPFQRDRDLSMLFAQVRGAAAFSRSPTALVVLDEQGFLRRGEVAGVTTRRGPEIGCGWRVEPGATEGIPLALPVYDWYFTVALRYAAEAPTRVRVGLDGDGRSWRLDPRESSRYVPARGGGDRLVVTNLGESPLCLRSATVGLPVPGPGGPL